MRQPSGSGPGDPVIFKVRTFRDKAGGETWDFGDGTATVSVKSDANADRYAPNGYAEARHVYAKSGHYLVSVEHVSAAGVRAVARLQVRVGTAGSILSVRVGQPVPLPDNAGDTWVSAWAKNGAVYSPSDDTEGFGKLGAANIAFNRIDGDDPLRLTGVTINPMTDYGAAAEELAAGLQTLGAVDKDFDPPVLPARVLLAAGLPQVQPRRRGEPLCVYDRGLEQPGGLSPDRRSDYAAIGYR